MCECADEGKDVKIYVWINTVKSLLFNQKNPVGFKVGRKKTQTNNSVP